MVGAGELCCVDQRGVVEAVGKDRIAAPDERADDAQVGHVTGREEQGAIKAGECGERLLQRFVRTEVAADEMRGAAADTPGAGADADSLDQRGIVGKPQIIVAGKTDQGTAVNAGERPAGRFQRAPAAPESVVVEFRQLARQFVEDHEASVASRAPATARPRCAISSSSTI